MWKHTTCNKSLNRTAEEFLCLSGETLQGSLYVLYDGEIQGVIHDIT